MQQRITKNKVPLIAIAGQPNSGKTTLFNHLSGKKFKTVNYPGSTVEYSISKILTKFSINANILDSPGIISLIPSSPDEELSVNTLYAHPDYGKPDIVVVTVDSSQISRHLYLVRQLINSRFNVIIVLTMLDLLHKKGYDISESKLSEILKCDVIKINSKSGEGIDELLSSVNRNIHNLENENGSVEVVKNPPEDKENLLKSYSEIGHIEADVIFPMKETPQLKEPDIQKINESLVVLNNPRLFQKPDEFTLKLDKIVLHKFWGLIIFFLTMLIMFTSIFYVAAPLMDLVNEAFSFLSDSADSILGDTWYGNLISQGAISGVGSVLVFLPQILILFLILGLLEDSGFLARGAMLIDKPLSKIGLNGKSFVPMLSGFACAIPAIMASRTITNKRERFLTIFIIPLMSCSARLPVYAILIAFLIPQDKAFTGGLILTVIYIFSIASSVIIASVINKFSDVFLRSNDNSSFILELPAYRMPKIKRAVTNMFSNAKQYIFKAGPVILYLSLIIWILTYLPNYNPVVDGTGKSEQEIVSLKNSERIATSYASHLGNLIEPVMKPIGMDWRVGVSLIATFAAREVFVSSLTLIFKVTDTGEDIQNSLLSAMRNATFENTEVKIFTTATTAGLIVFFIFALQCLSTVAISRKETGSWRIPVLQIVVFTSIAYILAFVTVNGLRFFGIN
ncbi:MAG: ferrous iron transport protein B [Bacteroidetes bacterium]|nr:ferrous iron transport protein B [Bacteroidota bacterium]